MAIDKTATIDKTSEISESAEIAANVYIGPNCKIGDNVQIGFGAYIDKNTTIGSGTRISHHAHLGAEPQDFTYRGEDTRLIIGKDCMIREFAPIHRATTKENWETVIGDRVLVMTLSHVGHDCNIGNDSVITTGVMIGGHTKLFNNVILGGGTVVHQFTTIGNYAMVGGGSAVRTDIAPFCLAVGDPLMLESLNVVGLRRAKVPASVRTELKKAFSLLIDRSLNMRELVQELSDLHQYPEVETFANFIANTRRPILRKHKMLGEPKSSTIEDE